jgi:hypothetical protein
MQRVAAPILHGRGEKWVICYRTVELAVCRRVREPRAVDRT